MSIKSEYFDYLDHFGTTVTLDEYRRNSGPAIALRHDIDYCIDTALEMAYWEAERGIRATYFLLHTTPYWDSTVFIAKCTQLLAFGHEIGLHTNLLRPWYDDGIPPEHTLASTLARLRESGATVRGTAAHGDPLCYERGFINYWIFRELEPADPAVRESGRNAEGIVESDPARRIAYPMTHHLEAGPAEYPLWSIAMAEFGLEYEASHVPSDAYFSDSGGRWKRTANPLDVKLTGKRCQILMHPIHWRGTPRAYFFLATARSGTKWLANLLDAASSCHAVHEYTLNHVDGSDGAAVPDKRTGEGFVDLLGDSGEIERRLAHTGAKLTQSTRDFAEANVYLPLVLPALEAQFPDAVLVHLHRNPKDVIRSLLTRGWYDTPEDTRHPNFLQVRGWNDLGQFAKCCHYVAEVHRILMDATSERLSFERMTSDMAYLQQRLRALGIAFYPVLASAPFGLRVNENTLTLHPPAEAWTAPERSGFETICGPVMHALGYAFSLRALPGGLWDATRAFFTETVPDLLSFAKRRSRLLFDSSNDEGIGKHIHGIHCTTATDTAGVAFEADNDDLHANLLIGTRAWSRLRDGAGWPFPARGHLAVEFDFTLEPATKATAFALMYDAAGKLSYRRSLGTLATDSRTQRFTFARLGNAKSFALALYMPRQTARRAGTLRRVTLRIHDRA